ncbi:meiosis expressed gene 1 protein homolog isoform X1 [Hoplias malabaricus]|uniref:meiosis expressed gene 1 protein homolog isoform X1 n=1 Tax=Hoplias malabaricus TaxID=27720 RepID=UPI003461E0EA
MSCAGLLDGNAKPKSMSRAKQWTDEVENLYRFQQAGYRDETEYRQIKQVERSGPPQSRCDVVVDHSQRCSDTDVVVVCKCVLCCCGCSVGVRSTVGQRLGL